VLGCWSQAAAILPTSSAFVVANELLLRGIFTAVVARWAQELLVGADENSALFVFKVLGAANEGVYRWALRAQGCAGERCTTSEDVC
jgi:hypothetical protein